MDQNKKNVRKFVEDLEKQYTVVSWEQMRAGFEEWIKGKGKDMKPKDLIPFADKQYNDLSQKRNQRKSKVTEEWIEAEGEAIKPADRHVARDFVPPRQVCSWEANRKTKLTAVEFIQASITPRSLQRHF